MTTWLLQKSFSLQKRNAGIEMLDCFGKDCSPLTNKKLLIFDMDGTIYYESVLFDGIAELFEVIQRTGRHYVFFTNNSSRSVDDYIERIRHLGISTEHENFCTSVDATISFLHENHPGELVHCMGTQSLVSALNHGGIDITTEVDPLVSVVLIGFDTELTSEKLRRVCELLARDVAYYGTNEDLACPVIFGYIPDCGAIARMIECATGRMPLFLGKPGRYMVDTARERFCCTPEETLVIGDRLYTDIASGMNAGVDSLCVLTGEATIEGINACAYKPSYTLVSCADLAPVLKMRSF